MPRGVHPNSLANLKKGKRFESKDGSAKIANEKSHESKRAIRSIADELKSILDVEDGKGNTRRKALAAKLVVNMDKSPEWYKLGLRMIGELPPDKIQVENVDLSALDRAFEDADMT